MLNVKHLISNILVLISGTFHVSIVSQIQQNHPTSFKSITYWKKNGMSNFVFSTLPPLFPLLRRRCFSVSLDHIWWHVLDGYSDSDCISRTLCLYRKIFKTILMGLWINKCDITHHSSLNSHCSRVTFLSYRRWKSRRQRARLQHGSTFVVAVFCCIHGFHSSSNPLWYRKGRLKFKYFTNRLKLDSSNTFKMEQRSFWRFPNCSLQPNETKSAQPLLNNCRGQVYDMQWIWWVKLKPLIS